MAFTVLQQLAASGSIHARIQSVVRACDSGTERLQVALLRPVALVCRTANKPAGQAPKLLKDFEWRLGQVLKIADPNAWLRVTKLWQLRGTPEKGQALRTTVTFDTCNLMLAPQVMIMRNFNKYTRILAAVDVLKEPAEMNVCLGQRIPVVSKVNKWGFKTLNISPEVQLGIDISSMEPKINVLTGDDDFSGLSVSPLTHPAVPVTGAALYAAMMRWRFPINAKVSLASFKRPNGQVVDLDLFTKTQREGSNKVCTTNLWGAVLTLRI